MDRRTATLVASGVSVIAVAYGLARYGYGLLLPDIRRSFAVSNAALGFIATGAYASYLLATLAVSSLTARRGPRFAVVLGGLAGAAGMLILAVAGSSAALAGGVALAGVSGALVYPPLADVVAQRVPRAAQPRALAAISAGTGWGVLLSVPIAFAVGTQWRLAWAIFAVIALAVTAWVAVTLRPGSAAEGTGPPQPVELHMSWFVCPRSGPLLAGAFVVGLGSAVYWTFAVDYVTAGSLPSAAGPIVLAVVGVASVFGSFAADLIERVGGRAALRVTALALALSLCLLVAGRGSWAVVLLSGAAFGSAYNLVLAVQVIWSGRVFAQRPSAGLAAVMFMLGVGQLIGPAAAGVIADAAGTDTAFLVGAAAIALATLAVPREEIRIAAARPEPAR